MGNMPTTEQLNKSVQFILLYQQLCQEFGYHVTYDGGGAASDVSPLLPDEQADHWNYVDDHKHIDMDLGVIK